MKIIDILSRKKTLSFEFFPPKTEDDFGLFINTIKELKKYNPDFISVTDSQISAKMKHIALSKFIKEKLNLNPLVHLTCINNTKKEIANSIRAIEESGIFNILALRGDKRNFSSISNDFKYATDLIERIPKDKFSIGIAAHPQGHPEGNFKKDIIYLKKKKELGADFAITQIFFDNETFFRFRDRFKKEVNIPLLCGIMAITSANMFENIIKKTGDIKIPSRLLKVINSKMEGNDFIKYSIEFTSNQISELLKNNIDGIHFFTFNRNIVLKKILENIL